MTREKALFHDITFLVSLTVRFKTILLYSRTFLNRYPYFNKMSAK